MRARFLSIVIAIGFVASACGEGASRESLVDILMVEAQLSEADANCVADALYSEAALSNLTEEDVNNFSLIRSVDADSDDADKFQRYQNAVDTAIGRCVS